MEQFELGRQIFGSRSSEQFKGEHRGRLMEARIFLKGFMGDIVCILVYPNFLCFRSRNCTTCAVFFVD
jgi:hypothetical protein